MKNNITLTEQERRLVEVLLYNELHYYEEQLEEFNFESDLGMINMIESLLKKIKD